LIPIEKSQKVIKASQKVYQTLQKEGLEVLYDDRQGETVGEKFADCDLFGIPYRIVVSEKSLKDDCVEIKERGKEKIKLIKIKKIISFFNG